MNKLPGGWGNAPISAIADLVRGVTYKKADASAAPVEGYLPIIRATNISRRLSVDSEMVFVPARYVRPEQRLEVGDIVVATSSGSASVVGKSARLNQPWEGGFGAFCTVIRPSPELAPGYLAHLVASPGVRKQWRELAQGTNINNLKSSDLANTVVHLPPAEEQGRIVAAIDEQFSRLDAGVAALERARKNLRRMRASVLQAAVTGRLAPQSEDPAAAIRLVKQLHHEAGVHGMRKTAAPAIQYLGSMPDTWQVVALADMAQSIDYGTSEKAHVEAKGIPILRMGNLGWGTITYNDLKFLPREKLDLRLILQRGDLLFNRTNSAELVGKTAVFRGYPQDIAFASYLIRVRPLPSANLEWANIVLNSAVGRRYVASVRNQQVGQANVNGTKLAATPIPLPSPEEQSQIIAECERLFSMIDMLEYATVTTIDRSDRLRSSILSTAFAGDLVAQDPSDEPASVLLARIAGQHATFNSSRSKRIRDRRTPREKVIS
jgi:type I restriction enzyme S subunit